MPVGFQEHSLSKKKTSRTRGEVRSKIKLILLACAGLRGTGDSVVIQ